MQSPDPHARVSHDIHIRFYAELNDFLAPGRRQRAFSYAFHGTPSVKDTIEAIGVPHTEVDVILVDDDSVDLDHLLRGGERVAVYPVFELACNERRIILTRDMGILKNGRVTHGYWLRNTDPVRQLEEVVRALDLVRDIEPYTRCMECNGELRAAGRSEVGHSVPLQVFLVYRDFKQCRRCHRVYWKGSHSRRLDKIIERARGAGD